MMGQAVAGVLAHLSSKLQAQRISGTESQLSFQDFITKVSGISGVSRTKSPSSSPSSWYRLPEIRRARLLDLGF